jgi:hypothetical protein
MHTEAYRHGDVTIQPIPPVNLTGRTEVLREPVGIVLRRGTAAGNAHVIADTGAKLYEPGDVEETRLLVVVEQPVRLIHAEHGAITLPPGSYRVSSTRQGEDDSWTDVQD